MSDAFMYMYVVGLGCSLGVLTTVGIGYFIYNRSKRKKTKNKAIV